MNSDNRNDEKTPDGSTEVSSAETERTEELADGSQSNGTTETDDDTASGGSAD